MEFVEVSGFSWYLLSFGSTRGVFVLILSVLMIFFLRF